METFRFTKFKVYQDAKELNREIFLLVKKFPTLFKDLGSQMVRSSLSIVLNIAEGSAKRSDKDFRRYLENALGSASETLAGLDIVLFNSLIDEAESHKLTAKLDEISKQLGGLIKKLNVKS